MPGHRYGEHNELGGSVHGNAVLAGTVHGGIQIRADTPSALVREPHPPPWQLPAPATMTDREAEVARLEHFRLRSTEDGRSMLTAVSGLGGVGKTTLALSWLHGLRSEFPGGQLYADLGAQSPGGVADPAEVLSRFLRGLGLPAHQVPRAVEERVALYRSLTAERRMVVLLDDAATAAQVRILVPGGANVTVVTGRWRLPALSMDGCVPVHLEPLTADAAVELLAATLADDRVAAQQEDARALVDLCAGLPLAVRVAGARLAARPGRRITTMVRALTAERSRLEALAIEGDHHVRAALDLSYAALPHEAARLYRLLGVHPGTEFGTGAVAAALGGPDGPPGEDEVLALVDVLYSASLLTEATTRAADEEPAGRAAGTAIGSRTEAAEERHRLHDLVRLHALAKAEQDESAGERRAALRRYLDFYLATATEAERLVDPQHRTLARDYGPGEVRPVDLGGSPQRALDWLERELPTLMTALRQARGEGFPSSVWQLADAMWPLFLRRKHYEQWRAAHAEGLAAAREAGDTAAACRMLTSGGIGELDMAASDRALEMFEEAARLFQESGDAMGFARTLNYRGLAHQRLGRASEAAEWFGRAVRELPAQGDPRGGGLARLNLAEVHLALGEFGTAHDGARAAREGLAQQGDSYNAARASIALGRASLALGDTDEAETALTEAVATLTGMAAHYETARAVTELVTVAERRGRRELAAERCREALALHSAVGGVEQHEVPELRERLERIEGGSPDTG